MIGLWQIICSLRTDCSAVYTAYTWCNGVDPQSAKSIQISECKTAWHRPDAPGMALWQQQKWRWSLLVRNTTGTERGEGRVHRESDRDHERKRKWERWVEEQKERGRYTKKGKEGETSRKTRRDVVRGEVGANPCCPHWSHLACSIDVRCLCPSSTLPQVPMTTEITICTFKNTIQSGSRETAGATSGPRIYSSPFHHCVSPQNMDYCGVLIGNTK